MPEIQVSCAEVLNKENYDDSYFISTMLCWCKKKAREEYQNIKDEQFFNLGFWPNDPLQQLVTWKYTFDGKQGG